MGSYNFVLLKRSDELVIACAAGWIEAARRRGLRDPENPRVLLRGFATVYRISDMGLAQLEELGGALEGSVPDAGAAPATVPVAPPRPPPLDTGRTFLPDDDEEGTPEP
jgi:hypothetical protein